MEINLLKVKSISCKNNIRKNICDYYFYTLDPNNPSGIYQYYKNLFKKIIQSDTFDYTIKKEYIDINEFKACILQKSSMTRLTAVVKNKNTGQVTKIKLVDIPYLFPDLKIILNGVVKHQILTLKRAPISYFQNNSLCPIMRVKLLNNILNIYKTSNGFVYCLNPTTPKCYNISQTEEYFEKSGIISEEELKEKFNSGEYSFGISTEETYLYYVKDFLGIEIKEKENFIDFFFDSLLDFYNESSSEYYLDKSSIIYKKLSTPPERIFANIMIINRDLEKDSLIDFVNSESKLNFMIKHFNKNFVLIQKLTNDSRFYQTTSIYNLSTYDTKHNKVMLTDASRADSNIISQDSRLNHVTHFGRVCPLDTPEGKMTGVTGTFANGVSINKIGILESNLYNVKTKKIESMSTVREYKHIVGDYVSYFEKDNTRPIFARYKGKVELVPKSSVEYVSSSPISLISEELSKNPFVSHNDGARALVGLSVCKQAIKTLNPSRFFKLNHLSGDSTYIEKGLLKIRFNSGDIEYHHDAIFNTSRFVLGNDVITPTQTLMTAFMHYGGYSFEDSVVVSDKVIREGKLNHEEIVTFVINIKNPTEEYSETITKAHLEKTDINLDNIDESGIIKVGSVFKGGDPIVVKEITKKGSADDLITSLLDYVDIENIEKVDKTFFAPSNIISGKIESVAIYGDRKGIEQTDQYAEYLKNLYDTIKKEYLKWVKNSGFKVTDLDVNKNLQQIEQNKKEMLDGWFGIRDKVNLASVKTSVVIKARVIKSIFIGDKLSTLHGAKGVLTHVMNSDEAPIINDGTGTPIDCIICTLGIPSRMNGGMIHEMEVGLAKYEIEKYIKANGYDHTMTKLKKFINKDDDENIKFNIQGFNFSYSSLHQVLSQLNIKTKQYGVINAFTSREYEHPINYGYMHILRAGHLSEDKLNTRSTGIYSRITQQPSKLKTLSSGSAARFGEYEFWCLLAWGCLNTTKEFIGPKSDDIIGREKMYKDLILQGHASLERNKTESLQTINSIMKTMNLLLSIRKKAALKQEAVINKEAITTPIKNIKK